MRPACRGAMVVLLSAAAVAVGASAGAVPGTVRQSAMPVPLTWTQPHTNVVYASIACGAIGACTTIGVRTNALSQYAQAADAQHGGRWQHPTDVSLPSGGQAVTFSLGFRSIACPRQSACVAVGTYWDPSPNKGLQPMIAKQHDGIWRPAARFPLPDRATMGELDAIWCRAVGSCVVTGSEWSAATSSSRAFVRVERNGHWQPPVPLTLPITAGLAAPTVISPSSIACTALDACTIVGEVTGAATHGPQFGFAAVQHGTHWKSQVFYYSQTQGTVMDLASVSCPSSTLCVAVGSSGATATTTKPLALTYTHGRWDAGRVLPWQYWAPQTLGGQLDSVSCPSRTRCVAVGQLQGTSTDTTSSLGQYAVAYTWSSGHWSAPALVGAPATGRFLSGGAQLDAVACPTTRECEVVGTTTPGSLASKGLYPYSATIAPISAGTRPGAVRKITVATTSGTFNVSWHGPMTFGGSPIQTFTVVARASGEPTVACATPVLSCTLAGIVKKRHYVVDVTARNVAKQSGPTARTGANG